MGKAAAELAVSQPAVSQAITSLERTLRVRLFDRTPQGVEPTLHGRALLKSCVAAFDDLRQGMRELEFLSDPTAGEMSIGATEPMAAGFVSAVIEQLALQHPRLTFHIVQADLSTLQDRELRPRHIELAVGRILEPSNENDMLTEILFDDPLVVVAGRRSKWAKRPNIKLSELQAKPGFCPPSTAFPDRSPQSHSLPAKLLRHRHRCSPFPYIFTTICSQRDSFFHSCPPRCCAGTRICCR